VINVKYNGSKTRALSNVDGVTVVMDSSDKRLQWSALASIRPVLASSVSCTRSLKALDVLDSAMTKNISMGRTNGYIESGMDEAHFMEVIRVLDMTPGDYEWSFIFVGAAAPGRVTVFEYRVKHGTLAAEHAVIGAVNTAKFVASKFGKGEMKEYLARLKTSNDKPTEVEKKRAGDTLRGGCS
jgi:hypothetical protein